MSAWLLSNESLSKIANWIYFESDHDGTYKQCKDYVFKLFPDYDTFENSEVWAKMFAEELYKLNVYSLKQRYPNNWERMVIPFKWVENKKINHFQFLKSVGCWIYQSCEGDAEEKPLFKIMKNIEVVLMGKVIGDLKEFQNAKWE